MIRQSMELVCWQGPTSAEQNEQEVTYIKREGLSATQSLKDAHAITMDYRHYMHLGNITLKIGVIPLRKVMPP